MNTSRDSIYIGVPCMDSRIFVNCMLSIQRVMEYFSESYFLCGYSDIALARNLIVDHFLRSGREWLMWIDSDIHFTDNDWHILWEGDEEIVTAEYARKMPGSRPSQFGLGFTRVCRSVYEKIQDKRNDDGSEFAGRFYMEGKNLVHYHPVGNTTDSRWLGEDRGFFTLAALCDTTYRLENHTQLKHAGYFEYSYPAQLDSQIKWYGVEEGSN